jgi:hypothetical protein
LFAGAKKARHFGWSFCGKWALGKNRNWSELEENNEGRKREGLRKEAEKATEKYANSIVDIRPMGLHFWAQKQYSLEYGNNV